MTETKWALWKREDIMDIDDPSRIYLRRRRVITTPLFGVMYHQIMMPDGDRLLHDHPWPFVSRVVSGWYEEQVPIKRQPGMYRTNAVWSWNFKHASSAHRIVRLSSQPVRTLVLHGRLKRTWGFIDAEAWIDHETYLSNREKISNG